jgi:glyoxylase-like metal-dependent hydrolase (beta-lactamase superfamily II)
MRRIIAVVLFAFVTSCSSPPATGPDAAKKLIEESATAMGGWTNIDAVKVQELLTGGVDWEPMQSIEPNSAQPIQVDTFGQAILADLEKNRFRLTHDGKRSYPTPLPVKFTEVIDGDVGMLQSTAPDGKVTVERLHPSRKAARQRDFNRLPIRLLKVAKAAPELTRVADQTIDGKVYEILKYKDMGLDVELQIERFNKLPARVIYTEDDPIEGDTKNELAYADWKDINGVRLPQTMATFLNGKKIREERVRTLINNGKFDEAGLAIPDEVRSQPETGERIVSQWPLRRVVIGVGYQDFGREQKVELKQLAPGVFHVIGGTHHSLAVEMKDHIVVVEMPLFEERSLAVIQAIEQKIPGKPIKYGVITHYHIDHSGGLRAYAAKGATLIAPESIVPFVKETLERPHTVRPDSLAKAGGNKATVEGVADTKELTDGARTIQLISVPTGHVKGMLVAYLPKEKLVFVSDIYTPGAPVEVGDPNAVALNAALKKVNASVDRIVGGHGADVGAYKDLARVGAVPVLPTMPKFGS